MIPSTLDIPSLPHHRYRSQRHPYYSAYVPSLLSSVRTESPFDAGNGGMGGYFAGGTPETNAGSQVDDELNYHNALPLSAQFNLLDMTSLTTFGRHLQNWFV